MTTADRAREIVGDVIGRTAQQVDQQLGGGYAIALDDAMKAVEEALSQAQQGAVCNCNSGRGADHCPEHAVRYYDAPAKQQGREAVACCNDAGTYACKCGRYTTPSAPVADAVRVLVDAVYAEYCCDGTEANEPDDSKVSYPEDKCNITFGMIRRARAALSAPAAVAVPEGWALVPVEPTHEMRDAWLGVNHLHDTLTGMHTFHGDSGNWLACYRAMLTAAQGQEGGR